MVDGLFGEGVLVRRLSLGCGVLVLVVVACAPGGDGLATSGPTPQVTVVSSGRTSMVLSPSPSSLVSSSPTVGESFPPAPPTESADQAAVRAGWMKYWNVKDRLLKDPTLQDLTEAKSVTVYDSSESRAIVEEVADYRKSDLKIGGTRTFRRVVVGVPVKIGETVSATITYCHDVTSVQLKKISTGAVVPKGPSPTVTERALLERGLDGIWRVAEIGNEDKKC